MHFGGNIQIVVQSVYNTKTNTDITSYRVEGAAQQELILQVAFILEKVVGDFL